jgi:hypothetical protein
MQLFDAKICKICIFAQKINLYRRTHGDNESQKNKSNPK